MGSPLDNTLIYSLVVGLPTIGVITYTTYLIRNKEITEKTSSGGILGTYFVMILLLAVFGWIALYILCVMGIPVLLLDIIRGKSNIRNYIKETIEEIRKALKL